MKSIIFLFLLINLIKSEFFSLNKNWDTTCRFLSIFFYSECERTLERCIIGINGCLGTENCRSCVEASQSSCKRCIDDIFDETTQITLPDNKKTIICDMNNKLHTTVCNFYCRSLNFTNYKCEILNDLPICNCKMNNPNDPSKIN